MPVQTRNILVLGVLEGLVLMAAVLRLQLSEKGFDLSRPENLYFFIGVVVTAGLGVSVYVLRSALLAPRLRAGDRVDDELKQALGFSVAIIVLAGLVVGAGPEFVLRLIK